MAVELKDKKNIKILIAEDYREQAVKVKMFLDELLGSENLRIIWAENVYVGISMMQMNSFNLLITDGWMPNEGDGIKLANWAKKAHPDMPIIMLTAAPPINGTENIDVVIKKSSSLDGLKESVTELLKL